MVLPGAGGDADRGPERQLLAKVAQEGAMEDRPQVERVLEVARHIADLAEAGDMTQIPPLMVLLADALLTPEARARLERQRSRRFRRVVRRELERLSVLSDGFPDGRERG